MQENHCVALDNKQHPRNSILQLGTNFPNIAFDVVHQRKPQRPVAAADFSRIRRVKLDRFAIDRLMTILERLDQRVEVKAKVTSARRSELAVA